MKNIDIIIPTRNRYEKLCRCLDSIPKTMRDIKISVIIVCDGDNETANKLMEHNDGLITRISVVRDHRGSVYCRNLITQITEDALLYATDDIEFKEGAIEAAVRAMHKYFPDEDGVIGFNQVNAKSFSPAGVALVGQKFLLRYPNRKLFYPKYFHFSCQEIERLGKKLKRIKLEKKAQLLHYHPAKNLSERDTTHTEARRYRMKDKQISGHRRANKIIWGDNNGIT